MPEELSPEERLLRLIKGGEPPVPAKTHSDKQDDNATPASAHKNTQSADADSEPKKPAKSLPPEPEKQSAPEENKSSDKPVPIVDKPAAPKPVRPKRAEPKPAPVPPADTQDAEPPVSPQPPDVPEESVVPPAEQNAVRPQEKIEKEDTDEPERKKRAGIVLLFIWLLSGFTLFNRLLLIIVFALIVMSIWYVHSLTDPTAVVTVASIQRVTESDNETASETDNDATREADNESAPVETFAARQPKPFPYYMEEIGKKKLFRLVQPPAPPKPPEPERKEPEAPKVKIETLVRHLVLQGIVYDIGPPQAIIFDKKENKTLFLGNNEMVTDQVKIKEIQRGKIILEFEDQTQELNFQ
ncbi:MAG: hypothetical protein C4541_05930 [Candidatus Auribacter fodinae]|jgi:hypothetical protein|uniref:Type II secretion system protein GspC N-terminal domain-containing protein n=1 Tax=Candidatus Auribacter fodinae TaxID=2093366 RepID=A0A3A4R4A4_9BACT|nr:MAG: hypothetical protein C4541_05930 [Candidatus Auribacter fodinae]